MIQVIVILGHQVQLRYKSCIWITGVDLTNGKNYNTSFSVKIRVEVNTSQ